MGLSRHSDSRQISSRGGFAFAFPLYISLLIVSVIVLFTIFFDFFMSNNSAETVLEQLMSTINTDSSIVSSLIHGLGAFLGFSLVEEGESVEGLQHLVAIMLLTGDEGLEELIEEFVLREGLKPATKASIQSLGKVVFTEEDKDRECAICLDVFEIGGEGREMPCKHVYHLMCIEKWLGVHGSCPVCRHEMPMDEKQSKKRDDGVQSLE